MTNRPRGELHAVRSARPVVLQGLDVPRRRISVPERGSHEVPRAALLGEWSAIDAASSQATVRVVTGPAGSGKTTLLADYARMQFAAGHAVAWLSASAADNAPEHLRRSVAAAFAAASESLSDLDRGAVEQTDLSDLLELVDAPSTYFVVDDAHLLDDAAVIAELAEMWRWAPAGLHVQIAGCFEPPGLLSRARLSGAMQSVDGAALAFGIDDVGAAFEMCGIDLVSGAADTIRSLTDGHPAAIRLMTLRLAEQVSAGPVGSAEALAIIDSIAAEAILADHVSEISAADRQVLRDLAVVDELTDELTEFIAPGTNAVALLAHLRERGLPIVVEPGGSRISLHPLLLRALRAESWLSPERIRSASSRAAEWFASRRDPLAAVRVAARGGDAATIRATIEKTAAELILTAGLTEAIGLVAELPDDAEGFDGIRALRVALECISGRSAVSVDYATDLSSTSDGYTYPLLTNVVVVSRAATVRADTGRPLARAARSLRDLARSTPSDAERALALLYEAIADCGLRDIDRAAEALNGGREVLRAALRDGEGAQFGYLQVCVLAWQGRYRDCANALEDAESWATRSEVAPQFRRIVAVARASARYSDHLIAPCSERSSAERSDTEPTTTALVQLIGRADPRSIVVDVRAVWPPTLAAVAIETTWRLVDCGRRADAHHYASAVRDRLGETVEVLVCDAIIADASTRSRAVPQLLATAVDKAHDGDAGAHTRVWAHLLLSRIASRAGDPVDAFDNARAAALAGMGQPIIGPFGEFDDLADVFTGNAGRFGRAENFVSEIRAMRRKPARARLSPTELEVLRELPTWRSVDEIAADRHVSVNTVKSQLRSMYRKLGVSARRDAIAAGQREGLI